MIGIEVRTAKLEVALYRLAKAGRVDFGKVIKQESAYVLKTIIAFTPPPNRATGQADVTLDMKQLSNPLSFDYFKSRETTGGFYRSISRYIRRRSTQKLQQLFQNQHLTGFFGLKMIGSTEELAKYHRDSRDEWGKIRYKRGFASYATDYKRLQRDVWNRVGWTINGWIPAAKASGAKYPRWAEKLKPIKYAKSGPSGTARYNFGPNPFITAINYNIKLPFYQKRVRSALQSRIYITERKLERVLAGKAVNLGFVRVKGGSPII
jgi:hypothetical protein